VDDGGRFVLRIDGEVIGTFQTPAAATEAADKAAAKSKGQQQLRLFAHAARLAQGSLQ
jgi:hypothetical protein